MPELPEAETIVRGLRPRIVGRRIDSIRFLARRVASPASRRRKRALAVGRTIQGVRRRAKVVILDLGDIAVLAVDLRMTGRLLWVKDGREPEGFQHIRAVLDLDDGSRLFFDDARQFGSIALYRKDEWERYAAARFGPEPLEPEFTPEFLRRALSRTTRASVKTVLLDPRFAAGVGNLYANEACFVAGIRPQRRARRLRNGESERLHAAIRQVLAEAIAARGTTFRDYRDAAGDMGAYQGALRVYDRAGEPCPRCGAPIRRVVVAGRSGFYCPHCQR
jgi:formamidopyrimidine-DNA glycosylase